MNTAEYFLHYIKRIWWIIVFLIGFLIFLLINHYVEGLEDRKVRAFDAATSTEVQIEQLLDNLKASSKTFTNQHSTLIQQAYTNKQAADD